MPKQKAIKTPGTGRQIYTCLLHPEVEEDKPGKCPKCGMPLVPKHGPETPVEEGRVWR